MKKRSNIIFLIAVLLPLLLFVFPMWSIKLNAPQYPDGLTMYIWVSKITGATESTLQNVNILNHYIGMKNIEPDNIPELKYFPFVVAGMAALGLIALFSRQKEAFLTWAIVLSILGVLGIYDFYLWEYDYGHNLDPHAAIKIEGMVYQPPLIGSKWLLNFKATSWPHLGGIALGLSIALGFISYFMARKETIAGKVRNSFDSARFVTTLSFIGILFFAGCSTDQVPIVYGEDQCDHCMMKIVQPQFGAEIITKKGKAFKFDAIECLIGFAAGGKVSAEEIHSEYVTAYTAPKKLILAEQGFYLRSTNLPSPMGMFLSAFQSEEEALRFQSELGGEVFSWEDLKTAFEKLSAAKEENWSAEGTSKLN